MKRKTHAERKGSRAPGRDRKQTPQVSPSLFLSGKWGHRGFLFPPCTFLWAFSTFSAATMYHFCSQRKTIDVASARKETSTEGNKGGGSCGGGRGGGAGASTRTHTPAHVPTRRLAHPPTCTRTHTLSLTHTPPILSAPSMSSQGEIPELSKEGKG